MSGDTQPTQPLPPELQPAASEPRRRRVWPWIVAAVVLLALLAAGVVIGEIVARETVQNRVRDALVEQVDVPDDSAISVTVDGLVLPQLIAGELQGVHISAEDVTLESFTGDVELSAYGVPVRGEGAASSIDGSVSVDAAQLQRLLGSVDGVPDAEVSFEGDDVALSAELSVFGVAVPLAATVTPSADAGELVLSPQEISVGGFETSIADLVSRFGGFVGIERDGWHVCLADDLPAAVTLTEVAVDGDRLVASFDVDGAILSDEALQQPGTCS